MDASGERRLTAPRVRAGRRTLVRIAVGLVTAGWLLGLGVGPWLVSRPQPVAAGLLPLPTLPPGSLRPSPITSVVGGLASPLVSAADSVVGGLTSPVASVVASIVPPSTPAPTILPSILPSILPTPIATAGPTSTPPPGPSSVPPSAVASPSSPASASPDVVAPSAGTVVGASPLDSATPTPSTEPGAGSGAVAPPSGSDGASASPLAPFGPFSVPLMAIGGAALLVVLALLAQVAGAVVWLPIVRRSLGSFGLGRGPGPRAG